MLLNQYGNPMTQQPTANTFAMGAGQATIDGPIDEVAPLGYIAQPRSPWETWEFKEIDEENLSRYSIDQVLDIIVSISPEVNVSLWHANRFVNPYFWLEFENPEDMQAIEAMDRMMEMFTNYYGGFDTLTSQSVAGLFTRGGAFEEMVFAPMQGGLLEPVDLVVRDPYWVRFEKQNDPRRGRVWHYGQWINHSFKSFQEDPTILYLPLDPFPGPFYGRSMIGSAIYCVVFLIGLLRDIRRVISNQGYPRLDISVDLQALKPIHDELKSADEKTPDFLTWAQGQINNIMSLYNKLKPHQAYVHTSETTVNPHVGTLNSQGLGMLDEIVRLLERQAVRAMKTVPLLQGSNESLAESQADAQLLVYFESIRSLQRTIATIRSLLLTYGLRMQGILNGVKVHFGEVNEIQAMKRAQTRQVEIQNIILQMDAGLIALEEGQEEISAIKNEKRGQFSARAMPRLEHRQHFAYALPTANRVRFLPLGDGGESKWVGGNGGTHRSLGSGTDPCSEGTCSHPEHAKHAAPTGANLYQEEVDEFAVQISPEGSEDELPAVPTSVAVTDADADAVRRQWDTFFAVYGGLLSAAVVNMALPGNGFVDVSQGDWEFNDTTKRYRNTAASVSITGNRLIELRDGLVDKQLPATRRLVNQLRDGEISVQEYTLAMRRNIKKVYLGEWMLAKGGVNAMTAADVSSVAQHVQRQYGFLQTFADQIKNGELSVGQIRSRSEMYLHSSTQAFERGQASSFGIELPEYPGDGNQICLSRCKCRWNIVRGDDGAIQAYWLMNITAEHCESCRQNTAKWNPYIIRSEDT